MEHDSPTLLFRLACEYLISAKVIRPGPVIVVKRVAHAREVARQETFDRLAPSSPTPAVPRWTGCWPPTRRSG